MARTVTIASRGGQTTILVGEDGEVSDIAFERLLKANPDWSVVETPAPKSSGRAAGKKAEA